MTYKDIKLATLQKMFHDVTNTVPTMETKPYLDKMEYVCNNAIMKITAAGFGERKYAEIISAVPENLLGNTQSLYKARKIEKKEILTAPKGRSCYFEFYGKGIADIYVGEDIIRTFHNTDETSFTKYRASFLNDYGKPVKLAFEGDNICLVKNIAVYNDFYESEDEIYEISEMKTYDMKELFDDFYKFDSENSVICDGENKAYGFLAESLFTVNGTVSGIWKVPYIAYPKIIHSLTEEDEEMNLPDYLCEIIPYYMASELYLEDDSGLCVGWRNKFEAELREFVLNYNRVPQKRYKVERWMGGCYDI